MPKNRTATVRGKSKDGSPISYSYKYADLSDVIEAVRSALSKNGLAFIQTLSGEQLVTLLLHSSGQSLKNAVPLVIAQGTGPQAMGSSLTYSRRYGLTALLGVVAEEDDDALAEQSQHNGNQKGSQNTDGNGVKEQRKDSRPPQADYDRANPNWEKEPCTEPQRKKLWAMAKEAGYDEMQLKDVVLTMWNKESTKDLTKGEIQKLFREFEERLSNPA